jgi:hypothetical protein
MLRGQQRHSVTPENRLRLFVENVQDVMSRRAVIDGTVQSSFTIEAGANKPFTIRSAQSDTDDLMALMASFRKFTMHKEPVHFFRVCNVLEQALTDDDMRERNRVNREYWKTELERHMLVINGWSPTAEDLFNLKINGSMFHDDLDKAAKWDGIPAVMKGMAEQAVTGMVVGCINLLPYQRNLIVNARNSGLLSLPPALPSA